MLTDAREGGPITRPHSVRTSLRSVRPALRSAQRARPDQVGGPAAKARSVAGLSRLLAEREAEILNAQAVSTRANVLVEKVAGAGKTEIPDQGRVVRG